METESWPETPLIVWAVATRALEERGASGDRHLVQPHPGGVLVAVVDGLGHGEEAAFAAERAAAVLKEYAHEPILSLLKRCHTALLETRGVVMTLASFHAAESAIHGRPPADPQVGAPPRGRPLEEHGRPQGAPTADGATPARGMMTWAGVGDVEGVLVRADADAPRSQEFVTQRGGVLGFRLPPLKASVVAVAPGDTLVLATDGIARTFTEKPLPSGPPQLVASRLLERYAKGTDDALVLVAHYVGERS